MGGFGGAVWGGGTDGGTTPTGKPITEFLYLAMRAAGLTLAPGRTPSAEQYSDALRLFNNMIGWLNTSRMNIYTIDINVWLTASQKQTYTIGPGGDWNGRRPQKIVGANFFFPGDPIVRRPMRLFDDDQWRAIVFQQVYTYPNILYNDGSNPLSTLYFDPIPDGAYRIEIYDWHLLDSAADINALLDYPPGYEEALVFNLAMRIVPVFQLRMPPELPMLAKQALSSVQRMNLYVPRIKSDAPGSRRDDTGLYNYHSGQIEP